MTSEQQVGWAARVRLPSEVEVDDAVYDDNKQGASDRLRHWLAMLRKRHVIDDYPRHEEPWD